MLRQKTCDHLTSVSEVKRAGKELVCDECVKSGDSWVQLRICQTCGAVLCCDNSPQRHATRHYLQHRHPVIASAEPGQRWLYCFEDGQMIRY